MWRIRLSRDIEQIDAHKDDQEPAYQGYRVDCRSGVEALEEDRRGDDGRGGEEDVVYWVDPGRVSYCPLRAARRNESAYTLVENVSSALLK